ncbi:MAG: DNA adenine methylase [Leptospiraceae bacterium]|nr:DNA adenine methylase [Leptospiraceae bacterium]
MSGNSSKMIAFNYYGSKFTYVDWLQEHFPVNYRDLHFVDVFCGSMAVTLNKPYSKIDTANDINSEVVNFFKVLREHPEELITLLRLTPVSREEYDLAWIRDDSIDPIEKARRFYVRSRQSFYGLGSQRQNKGWYAAKTKSCSNFGETVNKWHNAIDKLWPVVDRLMHIQIENQDFRNLIPAMDFEGVFFYCDPPYPEECRNSKNNYQHEFEIRDHEELAGLLHAVKGRAMISSYDCPLMRRLYKDWNMAKAPVKRNNIRSGVVQECIWMNYSETVAYHGNQFF